MRVIDSYLLPHSHTYVLSCYPREVTANAERVLERLVGVGDSIVVYVVSPNAPTPIECNLCIPYSFRDSDFIILPASDCRPFYPKLIRSTIAGGGGLSVFVFSKSCSSDDGLTAVRDYLDNMPWHWPDADYAKHNDEYFARFWGMAIMVWITEEGTEITITALPSCACIAEDIIRDFGVPPISWIKRLWRYAVSAFARTEPL